MTKNMLITSISPFDTDDKCEIKLNDGPWITYKKGDLNPEPKVGDILDGNCIASREVRHEQKS